MELKISKKEIDRNLRHLDARKWKKVTEPKKNDCNLKLTNRID